MKKVDVSDVRTIVLVGHGKSGKTSLGEAILFDAKVTTRLGKVDDETSNLDTEPEELKRKGSVQPAVAVVPWKKRRIHLIVAPGDANFAVDADMAAAAADAAVVVVSAPDGVQVGTERAWDVLQRLGLPRAVFINKLDRDRADFDRTLAEVKEVLSGKAAPLQIPIGKEGSFSGVVDLLELKAYTFEDDGRAVVAGDVPADLADAAAAAREELIEGIASSDDALIEKYLEEGELSQEEIDRGLGRAILDGSLVPVLCGSAARNIGVQPLLDLVARAFPAPSDRPPRAGVDLDGGEVERPASEEAPFSAQVFKTISADVGNIALLRVVSGTLTPDTTVLNGSRKGKERVGQVYALVGKKRQTFDQGAVPGEIVGLAKLKETATGDTLCDEAAPVVFPRPEIPEPVIAYAVRPRAKGDEEKLTVKLADLVAGDPALRVERDAVTGELLLKGMGQIHIDTAVERLKRMGVEVDLSLPQVPYRETVKGKATHVEGKHKKQTGGRGQFGVVYIDLEPKRTDDQDDDPLEFVDEIFGGAVPRQFIPSVEKGIRERMKKGAVAGYPVVGVKVTLKDGKYHPVDSDGRSFERAGSKGFQAAVKQAKPVLLEPIMNLEVVCPDENMGDIMGDISSRRGKVVGSESRGRHQVIRAQVPMAEVLRYAIDLESITAGRGSFTVSFSHYEEVPANLAEKIIAAAKVEEEED